MPKWLEARVAGIVLELDATQEIPNTFAGRNGLRDAWRRELVDVCLRFEVPGQVALNAEILAHVACNRGVKAVEVPAGAEELSEIGADHIGCRAAAQI